MAPARKALEQLITTIRGESGAIIRIAAPLASAYLAEIAMLFTDLAIVGRLGSTEMAAVGLSSGLFFTYAMMAMGVTSIVAIQVAKFETRGDKKGAGRSVRQGFLIGIGLAAVGIALFSQMAPVLRLFGQDSEVVVYSHRYLTAVMWSLLPMLLFASQRDFLAALEKASAVAIITGFAIGLNVLVNYTLVFGKFGFPALGVAGAGYGTSIVWLIMFIALTLYVVCHRELGSYPVFVPKRFFDQKLAKEIMILGWPVGGLFILESGMFSAVSLVVGLFGAEALAASQVAIMYTNVAIVVPFAIGEAAAIRVAFGVAKNDRNAIRLAGGVAEILGVAIIGSVAFVAFQCPDLFISIFLDIKDAANQPVVTMASTFLIMAAILAISDALQAIATRALRGLSDTLVPMWLASTAYWVIGVAGGAMLAFHFGLGPFGPWWAMGVALTLAAVILIRRFMRIVSHLA